MYEEDAVWPDDWPEDWSEDWLEEPCWWEWCLDDQRDFDDSVYLDMLDESWD